MKHQKELNDLIQELLLSKKRRDNLNIKRVEHFQQYKKLLGQEQQLTRGLNKTIDKMQKFRMRVG